MPLPAQAELAAEAGTLMPALGEPLRRSTRTASGPGRGDVRVPLPSRNTDLAFPAPVEQHDDGDSDPVHRRRLTMRNAHMAARRQESTEAGALGLCDVLTSELLLLPVHRSDGRRDASSWTNPRSGPTPSGKPSPGS